MAVLDPDQLNQLADYVGPENLPAILALALETIPQTRDELRSTLAAGDLPGAAHAAHKLKSDCVNFGCPGLLDELVRFEARARQGRSAEVGESAADILLHVDRFLDALRNEHRLRSG
jgi:HPt (histidine-containing phosphotransfer) domain-containing protein